MNFLESTYGILSGSPALIVTLSLTLLVCALGFTGAPLWLWTLFAVGLLWGFGAPIWLWIVFGVLALIGNLRPIRQRLISAPIMALLKKVKFLPTISPTE